MNQRGQIIARALITLGEIARGARNDAPRNGNRSREHSWSCDGLCEEEMPPLSCSRTAFVRGAELNPLR